MNLRCENSKSDTHSGEKPSLKPLKSSLHTEVGNSKSVQFSAHLVESKAFFYQHTTPANRSLVIERDSEHRKIVPNKSDIEQLKSAEPFCSTVTRYLQGFLTFKVISIFSSVSLFFVIFLSILHRYKVIQLPRVEITEKISKTIVMIIVTVVMAVISIGMLFCYQSYKVRFRKQKCGQIRKLQKCKKSRKTSVPIPTELTPPDSPDDGTGSPV